MVREADLAGTGVTADGDHTLLAPLQRAVEFLRAAKTVG